MRGLVALGQLMDEMPIGVGERPDLVLSRQAEGESRRGSAGLGQRPGKR